jgi:flagellar protein FlaG
MVIRLESTRPVEAAPASTNAKPRQAAERPATETKAAPHKEEAIELPDPSKTPLESSFKPYSLSFRFDEELNRVVVKVIDPATGEVLREIPPESVIEALKQLRQAPGGLVDAEA